MPRENNLLEFIRESNYIERVYDEVSVMDALHAWQYLNQYKILTNERICQCHGILMRNQGLKTKYKGAYRDIRIYVGGREGSNPMKVMDDMNEWLQAFNSPFTNWQDHHVWFEKIHPFVDGNGRIGRIIMNWHRKKYFKLPLLVIHEGEEQLEYYKWFNN